MPEAKVRAQLGPTHSGLRVAHSAGVSNEVSARAVRCRVTFRLAQVTEALPAYSCTTPGQLQGWGDS
eukprot:4709224-Prymnesium_polylepis.1